MNRLYTPLLLILTLGLLAAPLLAQPLNIEAEEGIVNKEATGENITPVDKWNIWSKDSDADKKWSGGKVIQSPQVMKDRATPEEGAPPLHIILRNIPQGAWFVDFKLGRELALSLDGKQWRRGSEMGGRLGRFEVTNGTIEFWVDDRWAERNNPGFGYLDNLTLTASLPEIMGVANGSFELGDNFAGSGWTWFSREKLGGCELVPGGKAGQRCLRIEHPGERDWAATCSGRLAVQPNQVYRVTAWMKCQDSQGAEINVVGNSKGQLLTWSIANDGLYGTADWTRLDCKAVIPDPCDEIYVRVVGNGKSIVWLDDVAIQKTAEVVQVRPKTKVTGWAKTRVDEKLGRGMLAMPLEGGKVYLGWRLLKTDPAGTAFNVYRATGRMLPVKLNDKPLTRTTDFIDTAAPLDRDNRWFVKPLVGGKEQAAGETAALPANPEVRPYLGFKLQGDYQFQKAGIADLNGDGRLDYVIKQPIDNIDPADSYWTPSPDTYKLEAYLNDGTHLWTKDLGWGIERGIWYSPYVVYDFDGDGKAEVAVKTSEGDPRDPTDKRVRSGPEYLSLLDGMTGKEVVRLSWPSRKDYGRSLGGYNLSSRNQLGIAYLDGKTPCLLVARGTYSIMTCIAYQYRGGKLQELWTWDNREERTGGNWRGQGAHWMHSGDVDADGRDEVILGSCVIDDDGKGLWTSGLGHPDRCFLGDLDPARPGLEIFYHIEPRQKENGLCLLDAATGEFLWGLKEQTYHVGSGMAADIDPTVPGTECWAAEDPKGAPQQDKYNGNPPKWLMSIKGDILARDEKVPSVSVAYWDADAQRELLGGGRVYKYRGAPLLQDMQGAQVVVADIIGDWREEIITSVKGELRVYTTTIPATDRRVCLMQDPIYRADVAHLAMGYPQSPVTGQYLAQISPAMWLTTDTPSIVHGKPLAGKIVMAAPADRPISGTVKLTGDDLVSVSPEAVTINAGPGQLAEAAFEVTLKQAPALLYGGKSCAVRAELQGGEPLAASAALRIEELPLAGVPTAQAESPADQGGGQVQIRDDKLGAVGKAISHWDSAGHWLSYKLTVPAEGKYWVVVRYCTPAGAARELTVDGGTPIPTGFGSTGGFGSPTQGDWSHACFRDAKGQRVVLALPAGEHTLKLTNTDGRGMNLDYVALVPAQ